MRRTAGSLDEASADLGADNWQTFRYVMLPQMRTALLAGALLAFALSFDEVIVTIFTSGTEQTLPIWIYSSLVTTRRPADRERRRALRGSSCRSSRSISRRGWPARAGSRRSARSRARSSRPTPGLSESTRGGDAGVDRARDAGTAEAAVAVRIRHFPLHRLHGRVRRPVLVNPDPFNSVGCPGDPGRGRRASRGGLWLVAYRLVRMLGAWPRHGRRPVARGWAHRPCTRRSSSPRCCC